MVTYGKVDALDTMGGTVTVTALNLATPVSVFNDQKTTAGVGGPSEFFMRRILKAFLCGPKKQITENHITSVVDSTGSFFSYIKGYIGIAGALVTSVTYDVFTNNIGVVIIILLDQKVREDKGFNASFLSEARSQNNGRRVTQQSFEPKETLSCSVPKRSSFLPLSFSGQRSFLLSRKPVRTLTSSFRSFKVRRQCRLHEYFCCSWRSHSFGYHRRCAIRQQPNRQSRFERRIDRWFQQPDCQ